MSEFRKADTDKVRLDLWPSEALVAGGRAFTYGAKKYAPGNWALCPDPARYVAATLRHLVAWNGGEVTDDESGLSHLDHALASMAMLVGLVERKSAPKPSFVRGPEPVVFVEGEPVNPLGREIEKLCGFNQVLAEEVRHLKAELARMGGR